MLCIVGAMWNAIGRLTDIALEMHLGNGENMPAVEAKTQLRVGHEKFLETINLPDKDDFVPPDGT